MIWNWKADRKKTVNGQPFDLATYGERENGVIPLYHKTTCTHIDECEYEGYVEYGGNYIITLKDKVGNIAEETFAIGNIDAVRPMVIQKIYSVPEGSYTSSAVMVELIYSKPGVTLTRIELTEEASGDTNKLQESDLAGDAINSVIRFAKNGTVNAYFEDEYGNEGVELVAVDRIFNDPLKIIPVSRISDDLTHVDLWFEMECDENTGMPLDTVRKPEEITLMYNGIIKKMLEKTTTEINGTETTTEVAGTFSFFHNGLYTINISDIYGFSTNVTVEVTGIDLKAPTITTVKWEYEYDDIVETNGKLVSNGIKTAIGQRDLELVPDEQGYRIGIDGKTKADGSGYVDGMEPWHITNRDVTVTVVSGSDRTTVIGKNNIKYVEDSEGNISEVLDEGNTHSMVYSENGAYIFNLQKRNGLFDSYGVEIGVIDKVAPILELRSTEYAFYEREGIGTPFSWDLLTKGASFNEIDGLDNWAFYAYDEFGGADRPENLLTDYVEINFTQPDGRTFNPGMNMADIEYDLQSHIQ